jgi:large subunit ribosomal protein L9e
MKTILSTNFLDVVEGTTCTVNERHVVVTGPGHDGKGAKLERTFRHLKLEMRMVSPKKLRVDAWFANRKVR